MLKKIVAIATAFVGLSVGAGFASGQEILQFFDAFGTWGLIGTALVGVAMAFVGLIVLQLGSYHRASAHTEVLDEISGSRILSGALDIGVMLTIFSIGVVMFAGAGTNLNQQFGLSSWIGSVGLLVLVLLLGRLDVDRVSNVIGAITPGIIIFIFGALIWSLLHLPDDFSHLEQARAEIYTTLPNWWISTLNYTGFSLMVVVSMSIVIGGYYLNPRVAGIGGLVGGTLFGLLLLGSAVVLYLNVDKVHEADMPMLMVLTKIHPWLGTLMAFAVLGMIFNSALGMFYALTRRLTVNRPENFNKIYVVAVLVGFVLSFLGFRNLVTYVFPALGYVGVVLAAVMVIAWVRRRGVIGAETQRRIRIGDLLQLRIDGERISGGQRKALKRDLQKSNIEDKELADAMVEKLKDPNEDTSTM